MASKRQILCLYKELLRESQKFNNYNFRTYALRKVAEAFKESKGITDPKLQKKEFEYAVQNLAVIRRQIIVGDMYSTEKLVIENKE